MARRFSPRAIASSAWRASAKAFPVSNSTTALIFGFTRAMCRRCARMSSSDDICRDRMSEACRVAESASSSSNANPK